MDFDQGYLPANIQADIIAHALREDPNEACGYVVHGRYVPVDNVHEDPKFFFRVRPEVDLTMRKAGATTFVHSHPGGPFGPSRADMEKQIKARMPWTLCATTPDKRGFVASWGEGVPVAPLIGRPFIHGIWDCYGLIRDWYKLERKIVLGEMPRDHLWWHRGQDLYVENFEKFGFRKVPLVEARRGDCFIVKVESTTYNHAGVYLGEGLILHHMSGLNSVRVPVEEYINLIKGGLIVRYGS